MKTKIIFNGFEIISSVFPLRKIVNNVVYFSGLEGVIDTNIRGDQGLPHVSALLLGVESLPNNLTDISYNGFRIVSDLEIMELLPDIGIRFKHKRIQGETGAIFDFRCMGCTFRISGYRLEYTEEAIGVAVKLPAKSVRSEFAVQIGDGAIAQGTNAIAVGSGGIVIGGRNSDNISTDKR